MVVLQSCHPLPLPAIGEPCMGEMDAMGVMRAMGTPMADQGMEIHRFSG
jgi:hypothetical protein